MHALVTADTVGGVWTYARELVTGLARRGVRVTLVSFGEIPGPQQSAWLDELPGVDFRPTAFRLEWMQDAAQDLQLSSEYLLSLVREVKPDVLHLNQYCYGALPVEMPKLVVAHSDVVSWWVGVHGEEPPPGAWIDWYRQTVTAGLRGASAVVAPTEWMLQALQAYYTRPQRARVIYNGRDPNWFNPHVTKERSVVSVGRLWDAGKQISLLLGHEPPVPVTIVGSERHPDEKFYRSEKTKAEKKRIHLKGEMTQAQQRHLYSRASIYAATSRYEPFGLAPLEAALSRCAIVANDLPTFHEVWGDAAFYFRLNDAGSLLHAIQLLSSDQQLGTAYANLAYNRARHRFTASTMVEAYLELYHSLVRAESAAA
jgi:glycosyltransferase involved in cell wall biosynthesis